MSVDNQVAEEWRLAADAPQTRTGIDLAAPLEGSVGPAGLIHRGQGG